MDDTIVDGGGISGGAGVVAAVSFTGTLTITHASSNGNSCFGPELDRNQSHTETQINGFRLCSWIKVLHV